MSRFSETLLDHARSPRNGGRMEDANAVGSASLNGKAPRVSISLKIENNTVTHAQFEAFGCGVTIACGSVLTEMIIGRSVDECRHIEVRDVIDGLNGIPTDKQFCSELAVNALQHVLDNWRPD